MQNKSFYIATTNSSEDSRPFVTIQGAKNCLEKMMKATNEPIGFIVDLWTRETVRTIILMPLTKANQ